MFVDESHVSIPQIGGMYNGDLARQAHAGELRFPAALGARQPSAKFCGVSNQITGQTLYVSATPAKFELEKSAVVAEQVIRPTGLLDPVDHNPAADEGAGGGPDRRSKAGRRSRASGCSSPR